MQQLDEIRQQQREGMTVVFSTYQSIEVIAQAQRELLQKSQGEYGVFKLIICDEAHRTTGVVLKNEEESAFVKVHDNSFLKAHRRIYMTATPRLYADNAKKMAEEKDAVLCSMDNVEQYGEEIYRIGFGEAVEKQLLSDYRVLILAVGEKDLSPALQESLTHDGKVIPTDDKAKFVGCINALSKRVLGDEGLLAATDPLPMRRAVAFCSTIKHSRITSDVFTDCKEDYMQGISKEAQKHTVNVVAHHVDGGMSATKRDAELMWLKEQTADEMECRMLTNARCLSEGVDVPSLDAVVFVSPKNSQVDVVQAVGRVMRRSEGKKETVEPYRKCDVVYGAYTNKGDSVNYRVEKMRFGKKDSKTADKSIIYYNDGITITDIPAEAYEYVINGKSAIEWIMERYAFGFDPKSGITNDPNDWAAEHGNPRYILDLLLSVISVSVQTVDIVNSLPRLKFE